MQLLIWLGIRFRLAIVFVSMSQAVAQQEPTRLIRFGVTDCWGREIHSASIRINSIGAQASRQRLEYPRESSFRLSRGAYHVLVEAQGFFPSSSNFHVIDRDLDVRMCLTLAPIEGDHVPRVDLTGTLAQDLVHKGEALWVRLIAVYSDLNLTAPVGDDRRFSFRSIQPGRYVLLLVSAEDIRTLKTISVRETVANIALP